MTLTVNLRMEPAQHILFEGVLSDIPVGRLDVAQTQEFELPVAFVSCGRFEITAEAVLVNGPQARTRLSRSQLRALVQE